MLTTHNSTGTQLHSLYEVFVRHPVVTTDSRNCPPGSMFVALKGATFNGNAFAANALEQGCSCAVVDEADYARAGDSRYILVDDCLSTLQDLARHHRRTLGTRVIGITGTNGKTTTKELIATVLGKRYNVLYTQGNLNNHIGVPQTLLRLNRGHDIAVVEMGANHPGEIRQLVDIAQPDYGLITNVGRAHLEGFGSFEGVKNTKGELYDYLAANGGTAFINTCDADLTAMAADRGLSGCISYVGGEVTSCTPFLNFSWQSREPDHERRYDVHTHMIGSYNLPNMLAAATVGCHFGVAGKDISAALADYIPSNNRSQMMVTEHNRLIVDAYNANPTSMAAALTNFRDMQADGKMLILGEMGELGAAGRQEHIKITDLIAACGFDDVWLVGKSWPAGSYTLFSDINELRRAIAANRPQGKCILIKGSHSTRLYELPPLL